ncbi:M23 family metallopeptidase [Candidatus Microgenomates bacterium]|nr:MAG: M23 family metallopeptidase [Candidatus Microgenomates bacterium]
MVGLKELSRMQSLLKDLKSFLKGWYRFLFLRIYFSVRHFEKSKSLFAEKLYEGRGKLTRPFIHSGMGGIAILGVILAPIIANSVPSFSGQSFAQTPALSAVLSSTSDFEESTSTLITNARAEVIDYTVSSGDTLSGIAKKFDVSVDTILWANNLQPGAKLKPGQVLKISPVTGVIHKVKKGDTVYSLAKHYSTDTQAIVDYPFNTFVNDENFEIAVGQVLIIPDGIMPKAKQTSPVYTAQQTPNAGTVVASGTFVWPTSGKISQGFRWYHRAIDIANKTGTSVLAADAGRVITAGWPDNIGYGNRVVIDHGNGFVTLYAHLSKISVSQGQTVRRGDTIGLMGSTGRSTGPHLHFEIRVSGRTQDPMAYLK